MLCLNRMGASILAKPDECAFSAVVVDDEALIRKGLAENVPWQDIGVRVVAVEAGGLAAYDAILRLKPDLAIVDICMPDCDGLTLIQRVRETELATEFIILSGYEDFSYAKRAMTYGVTNYLSKPINKKELLDTVRRKCDEIARRTCQLERETELRQRLAESRDVLVSQLLGEITVGTLRDPQRIQTQLAELTLPLRYEDVCVLALAGEPGAPLKQWLAEAFWSCALETFGSQGGELYAVVNAPPTPGARQNIKQLLREVVATARAQQMPLAAAVGTPARTLLELPLSYRAAQHALQYRLYELPGGVYDAAEIAALPPQTSTPGTVNTAKLAEAILMGDAPGLHAALEEFFGAIFYVEMPPPSFVYGMCTYLVTDVQKRVAPYVKGKPANETEDIYEHIQGLPTVSRLRQWLADYCETYMHAVATDGLFKYDPIMDEAKHYIDENLLGKLLLSDVAGHVHLSESYFAALFRAYTGRSFRNYLLDAKIRKAKELLRVQHMSIGDVSEILGYEDYRAFTRAFKKQTGRKPSDLFRHPNA